MGTVSGDDFTGRKVIFTDPSSSTTKTTSVVVAQRPPIAFILTTTPLPSSPPSDNISVLSERLTIPTSSSLLGSTVNDFGEEDEEE